MIQHYFGLDVHNKAISYFVKLADGQVVAEGQVSTKQPALVGWVEERYGEWAGVMEAMLFSCWICDFLLPHSARLEAANP